MIPDEALAFGFVKESGGAHISKTMMLRELGLLLSAGEGDADYTQLRVLAIEDNVLLKETASNRRETFQRLAQFYGLRRSLPLFEALRFLWHQAPEELPLLAAICAAARDPLLRCTAALMLDTPAGSPVSRTDMQQAVAIAYPGRFSPATLRTLGENVVATWRQSGHLRQAGRGKVRAQAVAGPASTAYALFLGSLCGVRGQPLFETLWARLLDAPSERLHDLAFMASQRAWVDYRRAGGVVDVSFPRLMSLGGNSNAGR